MSDNILGTVIDVSDDRQSVRLDLWLEGDGDSENLDRIDSELTVLGGVHS